MILIVVLLALVVAGGVGYKFYKDGYFGSIARVEPGPAEKRFDSASPEVKAKVQKAFDAIKADDLGLALAILDDLSFELVPEVDITVDQQASLMDLAQQIRTKLGDDADAAMEEGMKKLEAMKEAADSAGADAKEAVEGAVQGAVDAVTGAATGNQ
ncbi:MAG: hypothetical protein H7A46_25545 [Verrucomicrobiales bacterium]|nr:hypothetical protein [Verrucomicrobiales bacterium]